MMQKLLNIFASGDGTGMAETLFDEFLKKKSHVRFFESLRLNQAAGRHGNIIYFCKAALGVPPLLPPKPSNLLNLLEEGLKNPCQNIAFTKH